MTRVPLPASPNPAELLLGDRRSDHCHRDVQRSGEHISLDLSSNHLTTIEANAFAGLTNLTELLMGDNRVTTVGRDVQRSVKPHLA